MPCFLREQAALSEPWTYIMAYRTETDRFRPVDLATMGIRKGTYGMWNFGLMKSLGIRGPRIPHKGVETVELTNDRPIPERFLGEERRFSQERRKQNIPIFSKYWLMGRRGTFRRETDRELYQRLDRHSAKTFALILMIIMLSILDAIFTLKLINEGAAELNPIMAYYLNQGPLVFFWVKYSLTCGSLLLVFLNQHAYILRNKVPMKVLYLVLIIPYTLVVQWELYLLYTIN